MRRRGIRWFRISVEAAAIVGSILLAFGIDAWWEDRQEREDQVASLELLTRDLAETIVQFQELEELMKGSFSAAVSAYRALSGPPEAIDRDSVSALFIRASARRTARIPQAAFADLLSSGDLRLIEDRALRDRIVRFYQDAERSQSIIEKNNDVFIDGLFYQGIFGQGLILNIPVMATGVEGIDAGIDEVRSSVGSSSSALGDTLWRFPPNSIQWDRVRGTLVVFSQAASVSARQAAEIRSRAMDLRASVEQGLTALR